MRWGGHFTAVEIPPLLTEDCLKDIVTCFQEQIHSCGKCEISFFATVNDYDYIVINKESILSDLKLSRTHSPST